MRPVGTVRHIATAGAGLLLVAATLGGPAGAQGVPTGNTTAIHLYERAAIAQSKLPYEQVVVKGLYYLGYVKSGAWNMAWGFPKSPHGYEKRVVATEITHSRDGRNVWEEYTFTEACPARGCAVTQPAMRIYLTKTTAYYAELDGPHGAPVCWINATKSWIKTDLDTYGDPNWYPGTGTKGTTTNDVRPVTTADGTTTFVSTSSYVTTGARITETDVVDDHTDLFTHSLVAVGKATRGGDLAYAYTQTISVPKGDVAPPKIEKIC